MQVQQAKQRTNGGNGKVVEPTQPEEGFIGAAYLVDVEDLRKTVQELGQKLANADTINRQVHEICSALTNAGTKPEVIEIALEAQFGKVRGRPRRRRGKPPEPTIEQKKVLAVMSKEPMKKRQILEEARVANSPTVFNVLSTMQRYGWIVNEGSKGAAAAWVITDAGAALLED